MMTMLSDISNNTLMIKFLIHLCETIEQLQCRASSDLCEHSFRGMLETHGTIVINNICNIGRCFYVNNVAFTSIIYTPTPTEYNHLFLNPDSF